MADSDSGLSYEEIGERTGLHRDTVRKHCDTALNRLRVILSEAGITRAQFRNIFEITSEDEERFLAVVLERLAGNRIARKRFLGRGQ